MAEESAGPAGVSWTEAEIIQAVAAKLGDDFDQTEDWFPFHNKVIKALEDTGERRKTVVKTLAGLVSYGATSQEKLRIGGGGMNLLEQHLHGLGRGPLCELLSKTGDPGKFVFVIQ